MREESKKVCFSSPKEGLATKEKERDSTCHEEKETRYLFLMKYEKKDEKTRDREKERAFLSEGRSC